MSGYDGAVTDNRVPVRTVGAVEAEVDGERILLSPKDFAYFGLTGAGAPVSRQLKQPASWLFPKLLLFDYNVLLCQRAYHT